MMWWGQRDVYFCSVTICFLVRYILKTGFIFHMITFAVYFLTSKSTQFLLCLFVSLSCDNNCSEER